jgi:hypothetical protein
MARTKVAKNLLDSQSVFSEVKNGSKRSFVKDSNANTESLDFSNGERKLSLGNYSYYSTESIDSKLRKIKNSTTPNN